MADRVVRIASEMWRWMFVGALVSLGVAGIATAAGADAISRGAGSAAWALALAGSICGLVTGAGRER